jgi:hypothetical protein
MELKKRNARNVKAQVYANIISRNKAATNVDRLLVYVNITNKNKAVRNAI